MKDAAFQDLDTPAESPAAPPGLAISVAGMTCAGCAGRVERALGALPGGASAQVNLALERADLAPAGAADRALHRRAVDGGGGAQAERGGNAQAQRGGPAEGEPAARLRAAEEAENIAEAAFYLEIDDVDDASDDDDTI